MENYSDLEKIKLQIQTLGLAIPGTLREVYQRCGKNNCACATSDKDRHGPYYLWDRKISGKLASKSIQKEKLRHYREWIKNRELLESLIHQLLDLGGKIATEWPAEMEGKVENRTQELKKRKFGGRKPTRSKI